MFTRKLLPSGKMTANVVSPAVPARDLQRLGSEIYHGVDKQSAGYKLLASMGWAEGQGLVSVWSVRCWCYCDVLKWLA